MWHVRRWNCDRIFTNRKRKWCQWRVRWQRRQKLTFLYVLYFCTFQAQIFLWKYNSWVFCFIPPKCLIYFEYISLIFNSSAKLNSHKIFFFSLSTKSNSREIWKCAYSSANLSSIKVLNVVIRMVRSWRYDRERDKTLFSF